MIVRWTSRRFDGIETVPKIAYFVPILRIYVEGLAPDAEKTEQRRR